MNDFRGRFEGSAQTCDFVKSSRVKCRSGFDDEQEVEVSYIDNMIAAQLILEWKEKALAYGEMFLLRGSMSF